MRNPNKYYYLLRELPKEWAEEIRATPARKRHIIADEIRNQDVVATIIRDQFNPLYQNWIYQMNSGIFVWADPNGIDANNDITVDILTAFGVPDWKDEIFNQYTTVAVMYPNAQKGGGNAVIQGGKRRSIPVG